MKIKIKRGIIKDNSIMMLPEIPNGNWEYNTPRNVAVMNLFTVIVFIKPIPQILIVHGWEGMRSPNIRPKMMSKQAFPQHMNYRLVLILAYRAKRVAINPSMRKNLPHRNAVMHTQPQVVHNLRESV